MSGAGAFANGSGKPPKRPTWSDSDSEQSNANKKKRKSTKTSPTISTMESLTNAVYQMEMVCYSFMVNSGSAETKKKLIKAVSLGIENLESANEEAEKYLNQLKANENVDLSEEYSKYREAVFETEFKTEEIDQAIQKFIHAFIRISHQILQIGSGTPSHKVPKLLGLQRVCTIQTNQLKELKKKLDEDTNNEN